jgi:Tol biopolymer transport system component
LPAASEHPLVKYRVIENLDQQEDSVVYHAEDTELHRLVDVRVVPRSSAQRIERLQRRRQALLLGTTVIALLLALVSTLFWLFSPTPVAETPLRRFALTNDETPIRRPSISPNGRHVAYMTGPDNNRTLWVQDLAQNQPRAIVGPTDLNLSRPFWSPDSQFVGFRSENVFKKVAVSGGPTVTLAEASGASTRAAWTPDGESVIFTSERKLFRVPARGGQAELWLEAEREGAFAFEPAFFSVDEGTDKLLYAETRTAADAQIVALDRTSGQREILAAGRFPVYAPSGHVIYQSINPVGVWAVPFSVDTMKATGNPFPISENSSEPSIAQDGTLVYWEGPSGTGLQRLAWRDREGKHMGTIGQPQNRIHYPALSPDQKRVAVWGYEGENNDIWIHDVDRPVKTRLTAEGGNDLWPTWSPAGDRIAFASARTGDRDIYVRRADGSGDASPLLLTEDTAEYMTDWSRDEKTLLFWRRLQGAGGTGVGDIFYLKRKDDGSYEEFPFLTSEFEETTPQFSPDERFIAYTSNESGTLEIYIQAFPRGGDKRRVSVNGGSQPRWRGDGKELFYVEGDTLMAVPISTSPSLTVGAPEALFSAPGLAYQPNNLVGYDVTPEGDRFVVREAVEAETESEPVIRIVQNWFAEFKDHQSGP